MIEEGGRGKSVGEKAERQRSLRGWKEVGRPNEGRGDGSRGAREVQRRYKKEIQMGKEGG